MLNQIAMLELSVVSWIKARIADESGASLVEYALLLALIAVVAIGALVFLGHATSNSLNSTANAINNVP